MGFAWKVNEDDQIVEVESHGKVSLGDVLDCIVEVSADPRTSTLLGVLVDNRDMEFKLTVADALEIGSTVRRLRSLMNGRIAIVSPPGLIHQLTRISASLPMGGPIEMRAFLDLEAARAWILEDPA